MLGLTVAPKQVPEGGIRDAVRILFASAIHPHRQSYLLGSDQHPRHELRIIIDEISVLDALPEQVCGKLQACAQGSNTGPRNTLHPGLRDTIRRWMRIA